MAKRRYIKKPAIGKDGQIGLTLVELLVVLTILALAASVVVLNAPPSRPQARDAAERFAARLQSSFDAAVVDGTAYRLEIRPSEYRLAQYRNNEWRPVYRETVAGGDDDIILRAEIKDASADNALALNGGAMQREDKDKTSFDIPLDPFAGVPSAEIHFESRRGDWTVAMAADGTISVAQQ